MSPVTFNFHGFFTILWTSRKFRQTKRVFELLWKKQIYNVVVLSVEALKLKAQTFSPISLTSCNNVKPKQVSKYSELFEENFNNLKHCAISVHAPDWAPFIFLDNEKVKGRDFDVIEILAKALNFKLNLTVISEIAAWGIIFENGTATGAIKNLLDSKADIIIGDYYLRAVRNKFMDASVEYFNADVVFIIPPGRSLKSIEKLLQPFSYKVWLAIGMALLCGFLFVIVLNKITKGIYKTQLIALCFKALSILLGVSLNRLPRRSFLRILLASFIMLCLVLEAAYQGSLFRFLQEDSKLKELQSINEMIEKNYDFYCYDSMIEIIQGEKKIMER